ncbi:hypothetical protein DPMN_142431 [Dreissena polymorpha]|uniref:Uncharacterized protein n=1 Tax=Dreissena polymorpha TaxID=45954 RepID=A0A9D4GBS2_DREPO|nr:hypothetical protein DPMN_142430 [Dreissena polymorpha]KAH3813957.1 hypothetical protein DPMN_142431 [Dreissena polymorpha]
MKLKQQVLVHCGITVNPWDMRQITVSEVTATGNDCKEHDKCIASSNTLLPPKRKKQLPSDN